MKHYPKVTRVEVIDDFGRQYTEHGINVQLGFQDNGRTLTILMIKM